MRRPDIVPAEVTGRLKIWPGDLDEIRLGKKKADVRRCDDRSFRAGQIWELYPWDPSSCVPLEAPSTYIRITHVERMAGPLMICGASRRQWQPIQMAVLSFEIV